MLARTDPRTDLLLQLQTIHPVKLSTNQSYRLVHPVDLIMHIRRHIYVRKHIKPIGDYKEHTIAGTTGRKC